MAAENGRGATFDVAEAIRRLEAAREAWRALQERVLADPPDAEMVRLLNEFGDRWSGAARVIAALLAWAVPVRRET